MVPRFSTQEYANRYKKVRQQMKRQGIDCIVVPNSENIFYLTNVNFLYFGAYLVFPLEDEPALFVSDVLFAPQEKVGQTPSKIGRYWGGEHTTTVKLSSIIDDIRSVPAETFPSVIAECLARLGVEKGKIGIAGADVTVTVMTQNVIGYGLVGDVGPEGLNHGFYQELKRRLPLANFVDATGILAEVRRTKSDEEIVSVKSACEIADQAAFEIQDKIRSGIREDELFATYWHSILSKGGRNRWFMALTTQTSNPTDFGGHIQPYDYVLREGDIFIGELVPVSRDGYAGHVDQSLVLGEPRKEIYSKLNEVCIEAFNAVSKSLRPGARSEEVCRAGDGPIADAGLIRAAPLAYSMGLWGAEPPFVGAAADPYSGREKEIPLQKGMVIAVVSHVYDKTTLAALRIGATYLITEGGSQRLTTYPVDPALKAIDR